MTIKTEESVVQQTVLNCIDFYNTELKKRKIDKQYHIAVNIYDKNKSPIIGAKKDKAVAVKMEFILQVKETLNANHITLWEAVTKLPIGNIPSEVSIRKTIDQCFLKFLKECIGLFGLVAEQKMARSANG